MTDDARLLTDGEAARLVRMPPARLVRLARAGEIPCVLLPDDELRFIEADLWSWVRKHKQDTLNTEEAKTG